ncbi:MAG: hypothetical protein ABJB03_02440 [Rhodoglobus sp.]
MPSADDLRELERRAYSRDVNANDRTAAELELAQLQADAMGPSDATFALPPLARRPSVLPVVALGGLTALVLVGAIIASAPHGSLDVFGTPQAQADLGAPDWMSSIGDLNGLQDRILPDTFRLLATDRGWDVFAFRTESGQVCLWTLDERGGGGSCVSEAQFRSSGLQSSTSRRDGTANEYLTVFWGPTGELRAYDLPADQVIERGLELQP